MDGIGFIFGSSKAKKQQQEIDSLKSNNKSLNQKVVKLEQNKVNKVVIQEEYKSEIDKKNKELNKIHTLFPKIKEFLCIESM